MPRTARIDLPGILYHVLLRGIERRPIFLDDADRRSFTSRLDRLLEEHTTDCLAWALMTNHAHLFLRPRQGGLSTIMRRLLTAHALRFNLRHHRAGYLFQNRFKSIPCEEEDYLLVLVRYIHLNPLRAGMVATLDELDRYPWTGHAGLMGEKTLKRQAIAEVLALFGTEPRIARRRYRDFLMQEIEEDGTDVIQEPEADELVPPLCPGDCPASSLVLGGESFLVRLQREDDRLRARAGNRPPLSGIIEKTAADHGLSPSVLCGRNRSFRVSKARVEVCRRAIIESGYLASEVARALRVKDSAVSQMIAKLR
jgi:putative transposase